MTAHNDRGWWHRLRANLANVDTWSYAELTELKADVTGLRKANQESRRPVGPSPVVAAVPKKAEWSLLDRQSDPALGQDRILPRSDGVPRIWDSLPHS